MFATGVTNLLHLAWINKIYSNLGHHSMLTGRASFHVGLKKKTQGAFRQQRQQRLVLQESLTHLARLGSELMFKWV